MVKKADYFEQAAMKVVKQFDDYMPGYLDQFDGIVLASYVGRAMRRYHAKVRRLVRDVDAVISSPYGHGRYDVRHELLEQLDRLKKGH